MPRFSNEEKTDMVFLLGECHGNTREAVRAYAARYSDRTCPARRTVENIVRKLREFGSFHKPYDSTGRRAANTERDEVVLAAVHGNPSTSTRAVARETDVHHTTVWRILKRQKFHPYHVHLHQALDGDDAMRRIDFCMFMREKIDEDPRFLESILMSDEATFSRDGNVNLHNAHYWSANNPFWLRHDTHQERWSVNVWCGILGDQVVGPFFLPRNLTGAVYLHFLRTELATFLDNLPLAILGRTWFQQDGAPAHFSLDVRQFLNQTFPQKWIGRGGPVPWPARSPDLSSLDFFLWGYVKTLVYVTSPNSVEDLTQRIRDAVAGITPVQLANVRSATRHRIEDCVTADGWHFENRY